MITRAPIWCSVDLRDGNQAIPVPMTVAQKMEMFQILVRCGFKEIEVGFPAASLTEYEFVRRLIEEGLIPEDVTIQVLVQAREELIERTIDSLVGARRVIIHMYNSTSPVQREVVFGMTKSQIVELAVRGTQWIKEYSAKLPGTEVLFQYSPESFSATEVEFSLEICEAVVGAWLPFYPQTMIINLPETVEVAMPNIYADQIEWFCSNFKHRNRVIISLHTHNDRGTGVAATELGILAGADRVEGTLFGNGERTGNVDIITVALNLYTQGIEPGLDFSDLDSVREVYERCTGMRVPVRQPYSGELVFTAFSGSHQDAIRKGLHAMAANSAETAKWNVPYLVMDPADVGRKYKEVVIRVNGQSGKAGISWLLECKCGINMPKAMQAEFGSVIQPKIDALGREVTAEDLKAMFWKEYVEREVPYKLVSFQTNEDSGTHYCHSIITLNGEKLQSSGLGNGPISAFINSLKDLEINVSVLDQSEHALGVGEEASAIAYVQLQFSNGKTRWGAGVDTSIDNASIKAVISALNRE